MARLFIPGPTDVAPEVLAAQTRPMIGHRSAEFSELFGSIQGKLRDVFRTSSRVYVTASSGSGLQEAAIRNTVAGRVLMCVCGAFGERWAKVAQSNGAGVDRLEAELGQPIRVDQLEEALASQAYDAVAIVHNETSTGVESPLPDLAAAVRTRQPQALLLVDAVSSAGGADLQFDEWELDVLFSSSQKCFALPPGLAFAAVSDRALARAAEVMQRGWYFDFVLLERYLVERTSTPATPAISLLYALDLQLDRMLAEGMERRIARHSEMASLAQAWASERYGLFAAEGFRSKTVTTIRKPPEFDIKDLNRYLAQYGKEIAGGYGPLKPNTFRIGHMGEITPADLIELLDQIDGYLAQRA